MRNILWSQSVIGRQKTVDRSLKDLLYIIYSMKLNPSKYINFFRKSGSDTGKANKDILREKPLRDRSLSLLRTGPDEKGKKIGDYEAIVESIRQKQFGAIYIGGPGYPEGLTDIHLPPPVLFYKGRKKIGDFNIAVVGSRKCTRYGREAAAYVSRELSGMGIPVVSGLALGIDSTAHRASVDEKGGSIAVMGCGPDIIYPPENKRLYREVISNGTVLTEFPPGMPPLRQNFPVRNRIISGISRGVIIVEAGRRSGAMITGEIALEQNREVFAVPGSIFSSASRGCHRLIKNGAKLVDCLDDVLEEFQGLFKLGDMDDEVDDKAGKKRTLPRLDGKAGLLYGHIGYRPASLEELAARSRLQAKDILNILTFLEMESLITEGPSNHFSRCD